MIKVTWEENNDGIIKSDVIYNDKIMFSFYIKEDEVIEDGYKYNDIVEFTLVDHLKNNKKEFKYGDENIDLASLFQIIDKHSGSKSASDIEYMQLLFSDYISFDAKGNTWDCECCGTVWDYDITLINSEFNTSVSFRDDGHFGCDYLPTISDIYEFIFTGKCRTEL